MSGPAGGHPRPASLRDRLRGLPAPIWILAAGQFVNRFGSFVLFFLVIYLTRLGYSPAQAGLAASAYGVGTFAAMFAGGAAADRFGRRATITVSMATSAVLMLALSQARGLATLTGLASLAGFAAELYRPAASALVADLTPAGERVTAFAVLRTAANAGIALGPAVAGFLAARSFFWLFLGDAATSVAFGILALAALPRSGPGASLARQPRGLLHALRSDRALLGVLAATIVAMFVVFQYATTLPLRVVDLGFTTATYGLLLSLNGLIIATVEIPATSVILAIPPRRAIAGGYLLVGLGLGGVGLATAPGTLAVAVIVATVGEILSMPVASAYVADLAPDHLRGRYQGALGAAAALGIVVAPALGGALYTVAPALAFTTFAAAGVAAALLMLAAPVPPTSR